MREIPLSKGLVAIVDDDDYAELSKYKWHATEVKPHRIYARRVIPGTKKFIAMHRQITNAPDGMDVDHRNRITLDNRRENLRIATRAQNRANTGPTCNSKTGFKGVRYIEGQKNPYVAFIRNGEYKHLGSFARAEDAAASYNRAALELWGEFAYQNFFLIS